MAAELDLIPKLPVLAVQTGIFLANLAIIKKLFVAPYLKVRAERETATQGSREEAIKLQAEAKEIEEELQRRMSEGLKQIRDQRETIRKEAMVMRQSLIEQAVKEANSWTDGAEKELSQVLQREKAKIPAVVAGLKEEIYRLTLSAS